MNQPYTQPVTHGKIFICTNLRQILFFLLFHQLADDEALIILQTFIFLVFPYAVDNCRPTPLSSKSSLTLFIHLFLCLPLLLSPLTCPCSAASGSLFPSILSTCPNHASFIPLAKSAKMILLAVHYRWDDDMARERTDHPA